MKIMQQINDDLEKALHKENGEEICTTVYPLFSSVVYVNKIIKNLDLYLQKLKDHDFDVTTEPGSNNIHRTNSLNILDKLPQLKKIILDEFNSFKDDLLLYKDTDFDLTTSWGTRTPKGGFSQYHKHQNCFYSGILYFQNIKGMGSLQFDGVHMPGSIAINDPVEWNLLNSSSWEIKPEKNWIVFFPSHLMHRIGPHFGEEDRYSLAFNFFPIGKFGRGDSTMERKL